MKKYIGIALLGVGVWYFLRKGTTAKNTTWNFGGISADWKKKTILVTLIAGNPTGSSLSVDAIAGDVYFDGKPIATIAQFEPQTIFPNTETPIKIALRPNLFGITAYIKNLITGNKTDLQGKLRFIGTARVQGLALPIDTTFS